MLTTRDKIRKALYRHELIMKFYDGKIFQISNSVYLPYYKSWNIRPDRIEPIYKCFGCEIMRHHPYQSTNTLTLHVTCIRHDFPVILEGALLTSGGNFIKTLVGRHIKEYFSLKNMYVNVEVKRQ